MLALIPVFVALVTSVVRNSLRKKEVIIFTITKSPIIYLPSTATQIMKQTKKGRGGKKIKTDNKQNILCSIIATS